MEKPSKTILLEGWIVSIHLLKDEIVLYFQEHEDPEEELLFVGKGDLWHCDLLPKLNSGELKAGGYVEFAEVVFHNRQELYYTIAKRDMRGKLETKRLISDEKRIKWDKILATAVAILTAVTALGVFAEHKWWPF